MRILFSFAGGAGHFQPMVPLAHAAQAAGHTIAVTGRPSMVPAIEVAGCTAYATGPPPSGAAGGSSAATAPSAAGASGAATAVVRTPLLPYDAQREERVLRNHYAGTLARDRVERVRTLCRQWRPDLLVCDEVDYGAMLAAEQLNLPYASMIVLAAGGFARPDVIGDPLHALRAELGLPPDPELAMLRRHLVLSPVPPGYRDPADPLPAGTVLIRPPMPQPAPGETTMPGGTLAPWPGWLPAAPLVYFTLGTEFNVESGDLFERVLAGLADLPVNLLVTVGRQVDPAQLGPQPGHIRVQRYVPQAAVLPHCALSVSHAGSGSVLGALTHGLPMVLFPIGADQPNNGQRCRQLRLGRILDPVTASPEQIRAAVRDVLADPTYGAAARRLAAEIAAMPAPAEAVARLEGLVTEEALAGP